MCYGEKIFITNVNTCVTLVPVLFTNLKYVVGTVVIHSLWNIQYARYCFRCIGGFNG